MSESELVDDLYALREEDRVDVDLEGAGKPMARVTEVRTESDGLAHAATRTIVMVTLAKRQITAELEYDADADDSELVLAEMDGPEMDGPDSVEIVSVSDSAQQTLAEAIGPAEVEQDSWPPESVQHDCGNCDEETEHEPIVSEKTGKEALRCTGCKTVALPEQLRITTAAIEGGGSA